MFTHEAVYSLLCCLSRVSNNFPINLRSHAEMHSKLPLSVEFHCSRNKQLIGLGSAGKGRGSCYLVPDFTAITDSVGESG